MMMATMNCKDAEARAGRGRQQPSTDGLQLRRDLLDRRHEVPGCLGPESTQSLSDQRPIPNRIGWRRHGQGAVLEALGESLGRVHQGPAQHHRGHHEQDDPEDDECGGREAAAPADQSPQLQITRVCRHRDDHPPGNRDEERPDNAEAPGHEQDQDADPDGCLQLGGHDLSLPDHEDLLFSPRAI
jgi:hypothetical protein